MTETHYIHGTDPEEQKRLSRLNDLINRRSLTALALEGGERVLDVGSGLGQLSRGMALAAGPQGRVIGIERSREQLARAQELAHAAGEGTLVDFRVGDAMNLPLRKEEWGTFDVVHTRFLLEHLPEPMAVVKQMVRAVRPGGRIVLEDDDHAVFRMWPESPEVNRVWQAYLVTYPRLNLDANIGRRLIEFLHQAGAKPVKNDELFFGSCAGDPDFGGFVENVAGILIGGRADILATGQVTDAEIDRGVDALRAWGKRPEAAFWYTAAWAEGRKP
jgi:SAM-dependent methyltransferase